MVLFAAICGMWVSVGTLCAAEDDVGRYDVVWTSPSKDSAGSMPIGNGDISLNVWMEENGDISFYIGKTDAWGDNARLLKVGKVRISIAPNPLGDNVEYRQTLSLRNGEIVFEFRPKASLAAAGRAGAGDSEGSTLRLWVDANDPVIYLTSESAKELSLTSRIELWRTERYELPSIEVSDVHLDRSKPDQKYAPTVVEPDTILRDLGDRIGWLHHNKKSIGPELTMRIQGLADYRTDDPLLGRTFGAVITALNGRRTDDVTLTTRPGTSQRLAIFVLTDHPSTPQEWLTKVNRMIERVEGVEFQKRRERHLNWWCDFWDRSWIHIGEQHIDTTEPAFVVSRGYQLQRFINACAGRGRYPIKFNGSIFTVPYPGGSGDADYRRWGPGYWWQNTRLPYISMCTSGDFDLMRPLFRMYVDEVLPLSVHRTRKYCGHGGAFFPECIYFWGAIFSETYGWTPFEQRDDKLQESGWHKWEWVCGPELVFMMLDYYEHTQDEMFLREKVLPAADEVLRFFDEHYSAGPDGKLVMHPSQAVETWWNCTNPMPELAGLHAVTERLLRLPEEFGDKQQRAFWQLLKDKLPELPTRQVDGVPMLAPAEKYEDKRNIENPELYAVFPFRLVSFEKDSAQLGVEALKHRWDSGHSGWRQDDIFMAYLGLADQAKQNVVARAGSYDKNSRFPAFWGPNYDWTPDQDHGGVLLRAVQAMLLQTEGKKIFLLPAWPREWDVDFKLHAPYRTVVQGRFENGRFTQLSVLPAHRKDDVIIVGDVTAKGGPSR